MKEENKLIYPNFPKELIKSQEYLNQYIEFIDSRPNIKKIKFKTNFHHKIPDSLGGSNLNKHKIHLIHKDHWEAHRLLWKALSGSEMSYAFWLMSHSERNGSIKWMSSEDYSELTEDIARATGDRFRGKPCKGHIAWNKGRKQTDEEKKEVKELMEKNGTSYGKKGAYSEETKDKVRETRKKNRTTSWNDGIKWTEKQKKQAHQTRLKNKTKNGKKGLWTEEKKKRSNETKKRNKTGKGNINRKWSNKTREKLIPKLKYCRAEHWTIINPFGKEYQLYGNTKQFCKENSLSYKTLQKNLGKKVEIGKRPHYDNYSNRKNTIGWTLLKIGADSDRLYNK